MFEKLVKFGAMFDWISPLFAIARNAQEGPHYTIRVPWGGKHTGRDIDKLLKAQGIHSWGHMTVNNEMLLSVRKSDLKRALAVLDSKRIAYR